MLKALTQFQEATGDARVKGTQDGKPISDRFRYIDIFERQGGRWMVSGYEEAEE